MLIHVAREHPHGADFAGGLAVVKRAAELQGRSVSDFVVAAAQDAVNRTIAEAQIIRLSVEDQLAFAQAVLAPAPPNEAMKRAAAAYRRLVDPQA